MARPRAANYEDKSQAILNRSATLFAEHGYDRASITMIAEACGISKALLYHYYTDKQQLLFDIIRSHLELLLKVTETAMLEAGNPKTTLYAMSKALLDAYRDADAPHKVQLNHLHLLPERQQEVLRALERQLVDRFAGAIAAVIPSPAHKQTLLKPLTMSLFGMFNWNYTWFRENGPMSRAGYARLVVDLVIDGAAAAVGENRQELYIAS